MQVPDTLLLAMPAGLAAGAVHVLTGPDHLAAILPFAPRSGVRAAAMGLAWGMGHSVGVIAIGGLALVVGSMLDLEAWSSGAERLVGVLLFALGLWTLHRARGVVVHAHDHHHEEAESHAHAHVHIGDVTVDAPDHAERGRHRRHRHSALAFGVVHGVAGTSHLLGVAPALMLETSAASGYLLTFLLGSALAMAGFAAAAGPLLAGRPGRMQVGLRVSGTFALLVGAGWMAFA